MVSVHAIDGPAVPVARILDILGASVSTVVGSKDALVHAVCPMKGSIPGSLTFCRLTGPELIEAVQACKATAMLIPVDRSALAEIKAPSPTLIAVPDPRLAFIRVVTKLFYVAPPAGIHPTAVVDPSAKVHPTASLGPYVVVERDCEIGPTSVLRANVVVLRKTSIGARVTVHPGTVIGTDGFGYQRGSDGEPEKFPHLGGVRVEDDVEIGANTCIDRGALDDTVIGRGTKIDNLVHIAHNVRIGRNVFIIANSQIAGSVAIDDGAHVAPSATILNQLKIGAGAIVGLGAVVTRDVPPGATVMSTPARQLPGKEKSDQATRAVD
jgi:UDP-3-O-[3-hydroxymyristoyl] glucosamine N-acyltransferase